jgi:hypothetical protein
MEHIAGVEKVFLEFFANVKAKLRTLRPELPQHWGAPDHAFHRALVDAKGAVARSLADDFDTPSAMAALQVSVLVDDARDRLDVSFTHMNTFFSQELVSEVNRYMSQPALSAGSSGRPPVLFLLQAAAQYVSSIFRVFGLIDAHMSIGFSVGGGVGGAAQGTVVAGYEATVAPILDRLAGFREKGTLLQVALLAAEVLLPVLLDLFL